MLNKPKLEFAIAQLKILIAALKRDGDKAVSTKNVNLLLRLAQLEARGVVEVSADE